MNQTPRRVTITACPRCGEIVAEHRELGLAWRAIPHPLNPAEEALAWLAGEPTYAVERLAFSSWLRRRFPSPLAWAQLTPLIVARRPHSKTVVKGHSCPPSIESTAATRPSGSWPQPSPELAGLLLSPLGLADQAPMSPASKASTLRCSPGETGFPF